MELKIKRFDVKSQYFIYSNESLMDDFNEG